MSEVRRASFVVRAVQDARGDVSGVVERVATGAKEAFTGMEAIGLVIVKMLHGASALPPAGSVTASPGEPPRPGPVPNAAGRPPKESKR